MAEELSEDPGHWGILKRKVEERRVSNTHQLRDVVVEEDNQETPGWRCKGKGCALGIEWIFIIPGENHWPYKNYSPPVFFLLSMHADFHYGVRVSALLFLLFDHQGRWAREEEWCGSERLRAREASVDAKPQERRALCVWLMWDGALRSVYILNPLSGLLLMVRVIFYAL